MYINVIFVKKMNIIKHINALVHSISIIDSSFLRLRDYY